MKTPVGRADPGGPNRDDGVMTDTLDSTHLPPPVGAPPRPPAASPMPASPPPARSPRTRTRNAGHIVAIIVGCLLLVPGLGMAAGGATAAVGQTVATDDDGYFRFTLDRIESTGVAVATTDLWLDDVEGDASPWVFDFLDVDLRLRVDGAGATDDVFVGIARSADVEVYLADAAFSEVIQVDDRRPRYQQVDGERSIDPPTDQDFWTVSASGPGEQQLDWEARGGRWSVVVMNADGAPGVAADVEVGARSGAVTPIAIGLLVMGGVLTAVALALVVVGARGRRTDGAGTEDADPQAMPLPPLAPQPAGFPAQSPDTVADANAVADADNRDSGSAPTG